jgi:ribosomal protein S1
VLTTKEVKQSVLQLKNVWSTHWQSIDNEGQSVQAIVLSIDSARTEIKILLKDLK